MRGEGRGGGDPLLSRRNVKLSVEYEHHASVCSGCSLYPAEASWRIFVLNNEFAKYDGITIQARQVTLTRHSQCGPTLSLALR